MDTTPKQISNPQILHLRKNTNHRNHQKIREHLQKRPTNTNMPIREKDKMLPKQQGHY